MTAKTAAERSQAHRQRMRDAGFVLVHVWAHRADAKKVRAFAARLMAERKRS